MQGQNDNEYDLGDEALNSQLAEGLASYFERKNNGENVDIASLVQAYPTVSGELTQALNLLQLPDQLAKTKPNVQNAWLRFKTEVFTAQLATQTASNSLGNFVMQAIVKNDPELKNTGLPRNTLEALAHDATPMAAFQNYQFDDYAQLAKRYQVKNELFPRVLKWFKGLGKSLNLNTGSSFGSSGLVFAREESREWELSEEALAAALERYEADTNS